MNTHSRTLWFVRHGSRLDVEDANWLKTARRPHDTPLSPNGIRQARLVGERLRRECVAHIFASPFLRATETAFHCAEALQLPVRIEHGLSETLCVDWFPDTPDFLSSLELARQFPRVDAGYRTAVNPVYPETQPAMFARTAQTMRALLDRHPGDLLLVTHGGAMCGLVAALAGNGNSIQAPTCCLVQLAQRDGRWLVAADGSDTSHLRDALPTDTTPKGVLPRGSCIV